MSAIPEPPPEFVEELWEQLEQAEAVQQPQNTGGNGHLPDMVEHPIKTPCNAGLQELPPGVMLNSDMGDEAGAWVDQFTQYSEAVSPMTPGLFHQSAALWLVSVAIARRLVLRMPYGDVYPNLFILWAAPTTFFRKSTALNVTRGIARDVFPFLLAAQDTTPEAFLSDLAGREPPFFEKMTRDEQEAWKRERDYAGQRGWILDEMSGLVAASGRDYNQGLIESLLRFYDCDPSFTRSTRGQGRVTVKNSCLSILGASTPSAMAVHLLSERLWGMGWWPRFAILTPENERPDWREPRKASRPRELTEGLRNLFNRLPDSKWPEPPKSLTVSLGDGVYEAWARYNRALSYDLLNPSLDGRLFGTYGRLPTQILKIATVLAALDWRSETAPVIHSSHLARAMQIAESWRASAHRALDQASGNEFDQMQQRIIGQLSANEPAGLSMRDLCRSMRDKRPSDVEAAVSEMITAGYIEAINAKPGKNGGRPTVKYRPARS